MIVGVEAHGPNQVEPGVSGLSDEQLVRLALTERRYFQLLYERYADRVYWYATTRTGSAAIADDVVSETMLAALEGLHRFDPGRGSFATWLFTIAHRKTVDQQRHYRRIWRYIAGRDQRPDLDAEQDALDRMIRHEQAADIHRVLGKLSKGDQAIIALRYSAGLTGPEIASVLEISNAAARKRLSRAIQRLARQLEQDGSTT